MKKILEASNKIDYVYTGGVYGKIFGGRPQYIDSLLNLQEQVKYAHSKNVLMELAINSPVM